MKFTIAGFVPLTTIDFPGHLSSVIFSKGCPLRCGYCHNQHLQLNNNKNELLWDYILSQLNERKNFIEGVVFSGGEPLMNDDLLEYILAVKSLGLKIGIHTSGFCYDNFVNIFPYVNWFGFDIKQTFQDYEQITKIKNSGEVVKRTFLYMLDNINKSVLNVDDLNYQSFEARITLANEISIEQLKQIIDFLLNHNVKNIALQKCRNSQNRNLHHEIFHEIDYIRKIRDLCNLVIRE